MEEEKVLNVKFIIIVIICICIFSIAIVPRGLQNDTFYTIKLGELILNNGIDMQEHFAWHEGLPYTYPHWLYDIGIYSIYNIAGFNGIYISTIIFTAILGITIYLTNAKLSKNVLIPFLTTILVLYIGKDFLTARAQLITFILFVLTIYFIERFLETKKKRFAVGLIIIPILIANIHAAVFPFYFVLYLPYIAEFIISFFLKKGDLLTKLFLKSDELEIKKLEKKESLKEKQIKKLELYRTRVEKNKIRLAEKENSKKEPYKIIVQDNKNVKWLIIIMIIAAFTGFLTPIGDTPYTYLLHTMQGNTTNNISEHVPIVLYHTKYIFGYIIFAVCLIAFSKQKIKLSHLLLLGGLIFLTIMSRRQASMLIFVGIIVINKIICKLIEVYDKELLKKIIKYATSIIGKIIIYSIFIVYTMFSLKEIKDVEIVSNKDYPIEATEHIKQNLDLEEIKLYNEYNFGSYLLFKDIPVFIDSRADVYDPQFNKREDDIFRDFMDLSGACDDYEEKFKHYEITHLLIYKNSILNKVLRLDENYKKIYIDEKFIIYERLTDK